MVIIVHYRNFVAILLSLTIALWAALGESAAANQRKALVIGNDAYDNVVSLTRAINDANALGSTLSEIGFEVTTAHDVDRSKMNRVITRFFGTIKPEDEITFFYAGHAVELDGENYLLPTDIPQAKPDDNEYIKAEAIGLSSIMKYLRSSGARVSIAIIDACRDNPFERYEGRGIGPPSGGLRSITAPRGTFVIFSAASGKVALDSLGPADSDPNSVFTRVLLPLIREPGLEIRSLTKRLRRGVLALSKMGEFNQMPAYYDELVEDFSFVKSALVSPRLKIIDNSDNDSKPVPSVLLNTPKIVIQDEESNSDLQPLVLRTQTGIVINKKNKKYKTIVRRNRNIELTKHACRWLVMEEEHTGFIWPQSAGKIIRLPNRVNLPVYHTSSFPLHVYAVGLTKEQCNQGIKAVLPPNKPGPIPENYEDIVRDSRISNICVLMNYFTGAAVHIENTGRNCE